MQQQQWKHISLFLPLLMVVTTKENCSIFGLLEQKQNVCGRDAFIIFSANEKGDYDVIIYLA